MLKLAKLNVKRSIHTRSFISASNTWIINRYCCTIQNLDQIFTYSSYKQSKAPAVSIGKLIQIQIQKHLIYSNGQQT